MKRMGIWRALRCCALLGVCALAACSRGKERSEAGPPDAGPMLVGPESVTTVRQSEIDSGPRIAGSLEPQSAGAVRAETAGSVVAVEAEIGQAVRKGEVLARIEDPAAAGNLASARAGVTAAQADLSVAQRQVERTSKLVAAGALAEQDLEQATSAAAAARARLSQARAAMDAAQKLHDATVIESPLDGVVSQRAVSTGDVVAPGAELFTVIDPTSMRLEASVSTDELSQLEVGTPVSFDVRGYPDQTFTGKIERIAPAADPVTRQIPVLVGIPNVGGKLVAGLFAEGQVSTESHRGLVIPEAALGTEGDETFVLRIRQGVVERVPVEIGVRNEAQEQVEIRGNVQAGDHLLAGSALTIPPGTRVEISRTAQKN